MNKLFVFAKQHKTFFLSIGFLVLFSVTVSFAVPPSSPYPAGTTLDPQCAPGSSNCTVQAGIPALTSGSIPFANSSGTLAQDNANLYWDGINHRLGIGTTTPAAALTVNGDVAVSGNLSVNGVAVDPVVATNATVAYVETTGSDSTGALGKANRPFATINAALDALPSTGGVIKLGVGVFAPITDDHTSDPFVANVNSKLKDNVTIIGAKQPGFKSDLTGLEDGTIIQGPLTIDHNNIKLYDLGIDSGSAVVNSLYAGTAQNALAIENIGQVASPGTKAPRRGIVVHNVTAIAKDSTSAVHAALFENLDTPDIENIKTTYGTHGIVLKISGGSARGLYAQGNASDGVIIKANAYAPGVDTVVSDVVIRSINTYDTGGLRLMNNDTSGGTPPDLSGLAISNVVTDGTTFDVEFDSFNSTQIKNVHISNLVSKNVQNSMVINGAVDKASVMVNGVSLTGVTAGGNATGTSQNIAAGYGAFALNTSGYQNAVLGVSALASNTSGYTNVAIGYQSLTANVGGYANTAVGAGSLVANVGGFGNTALGVNALMTNNTGLGNTAIGLSSLNSNSSGQYNTAVGTGALFSNTTANNNSAFGRNALFANTSGSGNAAFAFNALHDNITGNNNAAFGEGALQSELASNNTAFGYHAGILATAGNNIFLGYQAGDLVTTGTNNIVLGYDVDAQSPTASNQLNIANLIYSTGIDGTGTTISTGNIGIGIKTTTARLEVQGTTSDNTTNAFIALNAAGSTPLLIVRDDGNIGINVAAPNDKLDVVGVSRFGASTEKISLTSGSLGFNRNTSTGAIFDTNGFAYQFQHTKSTTNTSDTLAVQVYNTAGTNVTTSAFAINGAGSVGIGTLTPSSKFDVTVNGIGATQAGVTAGISMNNTTAAALGAQQISPQIRWTGQGWGTTAGTSQTVNFREYMVPVQGTVPTGYLAWESSVAAGAFTNAMVLTSAGNLGIANTTPTTLLYVGSSSVVTGTTVATFQNAGGTCSIIPSTSGAISCSSDMNLKKNITTLSDNSAWSYNANITPSNQSVLARILALTPVNYNWNVEQNTDPKHAGFIAQEVREVFPDLVTEDQNTHLLSLSYAGLVPYTVEAIKEMNITLQALPAFTDPSLAGKVSEFLRGIAVDNTARVDTVEANKICLQGVCLTKEDFQQLLQNKQQGSNAPMTTTVTGPAPEETDSAPVVDTPPAESQTPEVTAPEPEAPPAVEASDTTSTSE